jgi:hypothetical protein
MEIDNVRSDTDIKNCQGKIVSVLIEAPRHEDVWGIDDTAPRIPNPRR